MKKKILILAANPKDTPQLRLDEEVRELDNGLQRAQCRDEFEIKQQLAARPKDIRRSMLDFKPNIVHFCGHGQGEAGIVFEDDTGNAHPISAEALAGFFKLFAGHVECVVLNGCYSEVQAKAIGSHIEYVIGMNQSISDKAAIEFAVAFYDALGAGKSFGFAYELACTSLQMASISEYQTPVLIKKSDGSNPDSQSHPDSEGTTEWLLSYDRLLISNFLTNRVDLEDFCFYLEHKLNPEYAYRKLEGYTPAAKSRSLVKKASMYDEIGELVFHLTQYWLFKINGSQRVLIHEGISEQLKIYRHELLARGEEDRQVFQILRELSVEAD